MKNEIVKIDPKDYGLEESKAAEIEAMFLPMLAKMRELETEFNHIVKLPIDIETCQMAKDLRLSYVKIRTGTATIHKQVKDFYLIGGRFVDGWKNAQEFASFEKEDILRRIENHFEIIEEERKSKLKEERAKLIKPYFEDINTSMLGEMTEQAFDILLSGAKSQYIARIEAEKKAEEERLAAIEAERKRQEEQRLENTRLKAEAEERERLADIERKKQAKILADQKAKADKMQAELLAKAETEKKERERLETQIRFKKEIEEKAKREAKAKAEKAANAPDKIKLLALADMIGKIELPEVKSPGAADIVFNTKILLQKIVKFIQIKSNQL
jgi:hypothetical protein